MKTTWKELFTFSRRERGGILVLVALIAVLATLRPIMPLLVGSGETDMEEFLRQARAFNEELAKRDSAMAAAPKTIPRMQQNDSALIRFLENPYYFDPNQLDEEEWTVTGLDPRIIRNILRYREKGGVFRAEKDLAKIYGMDEDWLARVGPWLRFPEAEHHRDEKKENLKSDTASQWQEDKKTTYTARTPMHLELNLADSASLDSLPGIGPSFARRIVAYRELLGGYYDPSQLLEVKGLDSARYSQFRGEVWTDTALIRKIDINEVTFKELLRHPYFEYYLVKAIINYRDKKKRIDSVEELKALPEMNPELYDRIAPYIIVIID